MYSGLNDIQYYILTNNQTCIMFKRLVPSMQTKMTPRMVMTVKMMMVMLVMMMMVMVVMMMVPFQWV